MIKNFSNKTKNSNGVHFILKTAKRRRTLAMNNIKEVQLECGLVPRLSAIK